MTFCARSQAAHPDQKVSEYDQEIPQSYTAYQPPGTVRKSHRTFIATIHL